MEKDFFDNLFKEIPPEHGQSRKTICGNCNTSLDYVLHVGRLGCSKCYNSFQPTLQRLVGQLNFRHVGKHPKKSRLEELMTIAAMDGRFDDAATYSQEIRNLRL